MAIQSNNLSRIKSSPSKLHCELPPAQSSQALLNASSFRESLEAASQSPFKETPTRSADRRRRASGDPARTSFESIREGSPIQSFIVSGCHQRGAIPPFDGVVNDEAGLSRVMSTSALLPSPALNEWRADLRHLVRTSHPGGDGRVDETNGFDEPIYPPTKQTNLAQANHILERLPYEVLDQILGYLLLDTPPSCSFTPRNADLLSCLLTCRGLHKATLNVLYKHITTPHSRIFAKMFSVISKYPSLGALVRRLDFSHYTVIGLGRTRRANAEAQYLTSQSLAQCLELMPALREFLVHEHIDEVLDEEVLKTLFSMPSLQAIDFCACSCQTFVRSFDAAVTNNKDLPHTLPNLQRLSLHECSTLQAPVFERLLIRLPNLTHLEVAHTLITDKALLSIPETARLTHLNLSRCTKLSGKVVVDFIINHPAAKNLEYLSLMSDAARHRLLEADDLDRLLSNLPSTLRSLNINGSDLRQQHFHLLLPLKSQLDELSIAQSKLTLSDINALFHPDSASNPDLPRDPSTLAYIDLTSTASLNRLAIFDPSNIIFTIYSLPLSVIEISDESIISGLRSRYSIPGNGLGWVVKESGRRAWLVRDLTDGADSADDGVGYAAGGDEESEESAYRKWKWGAKWWGMRKVPVAKQDVGGMFGHYMFKA